MSHLSGQKSIPKRKFLFLFLILALSLQVSFAQPEITLEKSSDYVDTCGGNYTITIENSGSDSITVELNDTLPVGFIYEAQSAQITSSNLSHTITNHEPVDWSLENRTIVWNATHIDRIYNGETITVNFSTINCPGCCANSPVASQDKLYYNYTDTSYNEFSESVSLDVTPVKADLVVRKVPKLQTVGSANWTIFVDNTGDVAAYNVSIVDVLGDAFTNINAGDGIITEDSPEEGWTTINWSGQTVPTGTGTWYRQITALVVPTGNLSNNVSVNGTCSSGCVYSQAGDLAYAARVNITKEPDSTETIGDFANFTIIAEYWGVAEVYNNTSIVDTLPAGLRNVTWQCESGDCGSQSQEDNILTWDLGDFVGPKTVEINLSTKVEDVLSNQDGVNLLNRVDVSHENDRSDLFQAYDTANISLVEPDLAIEKSVNETLTEAGSILEYALQIYHSPSSTSAAYEVWVNDSLPEDLLYQSGSQTSSLPSTFDQDGRNLTWTFSLIPLANDSSNPVNITYLALVNDSVISGQVLINSANTTWNSTSGVNPDKRFGGYTVLDDYNRTVAYQVTVGTDSSLIKLPDQERIRTIGERVNYTIEVDLPTATALDVWVNDTLPQGLIYDPVSLTVSGLVTSPLIEQISSLNNGSAAVDINWSFGDLNNSGNLDLTIEFEAVVADIDRNREGGTIAGNLGNLSWSEIGGQPHEESDLSGPVEVPGIAVTKEAVPEAGALFTNVTFLIRINNMGNVALNPVTASDLLPEGLTYVSDNRSGVVNGQRINWSDLGSLDGGESSSIELLARIDGSVLGDLVNSVEVVGTHPVGSNVTNQTSISIQALLSDVKINKTAYPQQGAPCTNVEFAINVTNSGNITLDAAAVFDELPAGLVYVSDNRSGIVDGRHVSWPNLGSLNPGQSEQIGLVAHIDGSAFGTLRNLVSVTASPVSGGNVTAESNATVEALFSSIAVEKTAYPEQGTASTNVEFAINVTNLGNITLDPVSVWDELPEGLSYVSDNRSGAVNGQFINWTNLGPLDSGQSSHILLIAHIDGTVLGDLQNYVNATGQPSSGRNVTSEDTAIVRALSSSLLLSKTGYPSQGEPGTEITFDIEVKNSGNATLDPLVVSDRLPYGLAYISDNRSGTIDGQYVNWSNIGPLEAGASCNIQLVTAVDGTALGPLTNLVNVTGHPLFGDPVTSDAEYTITALSPTVLATMIASPERVVLGEDVSFVINITNPGNLTLDTVEVSDVLPAGLIYESDNRSGVLNGRNISWSNVGPLLPGQSTFIRLSALSDGETIGDLLNRLYVTAITSTGITIFAETSAEVETVMPNMPDMGNAIVEPLQFEQFCDFENVQGSGVIDVSTSAIDKRIALDFSSAMAGEGDLEIRSERAFSERASKLERNVTNKTMPLNFFEETQMSYSGNVPLVGQKRLESREFYGGIGAEVNEMFSISEMQKEQTMFFSSTDPGSQLSNIGQAAKARNASATHLVGSDVRTAFNGTWGMESAWHEILKKDIRDRQILSGRFEAEKLVKFHEAPTKTEIKNACEGIDC